MPVFYDLPFVFFAFAAFVFGLLIGSFLNVVIYRVPRGESVAFPGSHCGVCGAGVKPYDNIPLVSYAVLGGKCRACRAKISRVYPAVELLTGLLFLGVLFKSGVTLRAAAEMAFVAVMIALVFIDARHKLLPNVITYPAFLAALAVTALLGWLESSEYPALFVTSLGSDTLLIWQALIVGAVLLGAAVPLYLFIDRIDGVLFGKYFEWDENEAAPASPEEAAAEERHDKVVNATLIAGVSVGITWALLAFLSGIQGGTTSELLAAYERLLGAFFGALVGGGLIWLLRALYFWTRGVEGMGLGDVKMMGIIGAFLGWRSAALVLIAGSLLGSIVGLVVMRHSPAGMKTQLPFGIFLGLAAVAALFFGEPLINWYFGMLK